jgi:Fic family protein
LNSSPSVKKKFLQSFSNLDNSLVKQTKISPLTEANSITQALKVEHTFSNWIEGNTLTMAETDLVINEGQTISGKRREHLEAINHQEAIEFIQNRIKNNATLGEPDVYFLTHFLGNSTEGSWPLSPVAITIKDKSFSPVNQRYVPARNKAG